MLHTNNHFLMDLILLDFHLHYIMDFQMYKLELYFLSISILVNLYQ